MQNCGPPISVQNLFQVRGERVDRSVFNKEARGHGLLPIFVRGSPNFRCKINLHQERADGVIRSNSDPKMALLQSSRSFLAPEATFN